MSKAFTDAETEHLLSFEGCGILSAPVWFLGMEEGGGGEENLRRRLSFDPVEDLYEAHRKLGITKHHEGRRIIHPAWRGMCVIMLQLMGKRPTTEQIRRHQAEELGRKGKDTFLLELMPLPKANMGAWGYKQHLPQFESRDQYYETILPRRIDYLRRLFLKFKPSAVIGYGKTYWHRYKMLFENAAFNLEDQFLVSNGSPSVVLSHHFIARSMNGKFGEIANIVKARFELDSD